MIQPTFERTARHDARPRIDVVVAVLNESRTIADKIADLERLDYPDANLRFVIVDGGSRDDTVASVSAWAARDDRVTPLETALLNKTAQLNAALERCTAEWVLVTDADARMPPETLRVMIDEALAGGDIGVVGTLARTAGHELESVHWRLSNWFRRRERRTGTTGLVIATCYLFRRALLRRFPEDCVADDVHVACRAAVAGSRVGLADVTVFETRAASSSRDFVRLKLRRTRAYLREVLRFLPLARHMPRPMRAVFAWRVLALVGIPAVALAAIAGTLYVAPLLPTLAGLSATLAVVGVLRAHRPRKGAVMVVYSALTVTVMSLALLSYPFVRETACFKRVGTP